MKFTVLEWEYVEDAGFLIKFTVASNKEDRAEVYTVPVSYKGEDPQLFMMTVRNHMIAQVVKTDNLKAAKRLLSGFTFTEPVIHYHEEVGDNNVH
jgi:hypothetical protein